MNIPVKHIPPGKLFEGEIGTTKRDRAQALVDALDFAAYRNLGNPAFFKLLPEKVTKALMAYSAVEAGEIVDHVVLNATSLNLASPQAKPYLEQCQKMVRQIPIVYGAKEDSYSLTK